jgi:hypothetical protein
MLLEVQRTKRASGFPAFSAPAVVRGSQSQLSSISHYLEPAIRGAAEVEQDAFWIVMPSAGQIHLPPHRPV